jgi:transcription elongation factor GreA
MTTEQHTGLPLTDAARRRLRDELDHLRSDHEPVCRDRVRELRAGMGEDLELSLALQELTRLQQRIRELETILATQPDEPLLLPPGFITIGSRVAVRDASGRQQTFVLVSPLEASITQGGVSTTSPVGAALLGHRAGDAVRVDVPAGVRILTVISVE